MGIYLSQPNKTKHIEDAVSQNGTHFGVSEMQGWRSHMEDSSIFVDYDNKVEIYGVFDGHGGFTVSQWIKEHFGTVWSDVIAKTADTKVDGVEVGEYEGKCIEALKNTFLEVDNRLDDATGRQQLREIYKQRPVQKDDPQSTMAVLQRFLNAKGIQSANLVEPIVEEAEPDLGSTQTVETAPTDGTEPGTPDACGATAVVAMICNDPSVADGDLLVVANAGDSRAVLSRGGTAVALSLDHKPTNDGEMARIVAAGGFVTEGRVDGNLNLSRSLGDLTYKTPKEAVPSQRKITSMPEVRVGRLFEEDEFLVLACDGIWDCLSNQQVVDIVRQRLQSPEYKSGDLKLSQIASDIFDSIISSDPLATEGIGCDNMTCMIVDLSKRRKGAKNDEFINIPVKDP